MSDDPAHVLFPTDAPRPAATPDWYHAQATAAETRLAGGQRQEVPSAASSSADTDQPNAADQLFSTENKGFDDRVVSGFLDPFTLGAIGDGDEQRAGELKAATAALSEDFRAAGTDSNELQGAFEILREANDHVVPPTPEKIASDMNESLAALQAELGPSFQSDLNAARAFVRDLEMVAPGTIASLERNGAGNDLRLIKAAIREARRRKY